MSSAPGQHPTESTHPDILYIFVDGDGHHQLTEYDLYRKIVELVMHNPEVTFRRSEHGTLGGFPLMVLVEVVPIE